MTRQVTKCLRHYVLKEMAEHIFADFVMYISMLNLNPDLLMAISHILDAFFLLPPRINTILDLLLKAAKKIKCIMEVIKEVVAILKEILN